MCVGGGCGVRGSVGVIGREGGGREGEGGEGAAGEGKGGGHLRGGGGVRSVLLLFLWREPLAYWWLAVAGCTGLLAVAGCCILSSQ